MTPIDWTPEGFAEALERSLKKLKPILLSGAPYDIMTRFELGPAGIHYCCPITLVLLAETGRYYSVEYYREAAELLGGDADSAGAIMQQADGTPGPYRAAMKRVLDSWEVA